MSIWKFLYHKIDGIFAISVILMLLSGLWAPFTDATWAAIDGHVLGMLFCLMLVIENLTEAHVFTWLGYRLLSRYRRTRIIATILVLLNFVAAMGMTNDVALLTFIPFTILLFGTSKHPTLLIDTIILETVAANLGSQLTPVGNPQNLYLYSHFQLPLSAFLSHMAIPTLLALICLLISTRILPDEPLPNHLSGAVRPHLFRTAIWMGAFVLCFLTILRIFPAPILFFTLPAIALLFYRRSLRQLDYSLLLTFTALFIFIHNLLQLPFLHVTVIPFIQSHLYLSAIALSQVLSNVPATLFLALLTDDWRTLLYGVNIGGLGTLIASMASLISYKIYLVEHADTKYRFLWRFTFYNVLMLLILATTGAVLLS